MNSREITIPAGSIHAFVGALMGIFKNGATAIRKELKYRSDIRVLHSLSDIILDDMGIHRYEIESIVRKKAVLENVPAATALADVVKFPTNKTFSSNEKHAAAA